MAYLRVEKPRFLFLEGSAGAKATAVAATVEPPDASAARAGTSAARAASSVDRQALAPPPPPRLSVRGAQAPTSQGGPAPRFAFLLLFFLRRRVL
jgi:hypothetical protein